MNLIKTLSVLTLAAAMSYGCSSDSSTPSPNGIYSGTVTGGDATRNGIEEKGIIYNDRFMVLSRQADGINQFFDSSLTVLNTTVSGTGSRYSNIEFKNTIAFDGVFIENQSATIDFAATGNNSNNLPSGTINLTASTALLSKGSAISKLQGSWTGGFGGTVGGGQMDLVINTSGEITFGEDQFPFVCTFEGSLSPADTSVNVYQVNITSSGGVPCTMSVGDYTGLAWTEGDSDGTLVLMVANGADGRAVVLTKN